MASTSGSTITRLPYEQRRHALHYASEDGTVGETRYPINYEEFYNLKGRVLTIVDATFSDPQQRKAMKDVVSQALHGWMRDIEYEATWHDESRPPQWTAESGVTP